MRSRWANSPATRPNGNKNLLELLFEILARQPCCIHQPEIVHSSQFDFEALKAEREHASDRLAGPSANGGDESLASDLEHALYASKIVSYAQGFAQMAAAAEDEGWDIDLGSMATIWRGGCIIRARFLDRIREAYDDEPALSNLMLADFFAKALEEAQDPWRRVVARAAELGIPAPAFSASLAYYDG